MSLKQEIETWVAALGHYDGGDYVKALEQFDGIADTSKILFNCGVIYATLTEHEKAVEYYQRAVQLDQYLAVAYFQQGVSNFLMGDFEEALANFNDTLLYLRGNNNIDYEQLGLKFKLYSCEVLFNRGLCYIYLEQKEAGMQDLAFAAKEKVVPDHDVIDEAIEDGAQDYTVFSIPIGIVYRPNEAKVKNLKTKDYLGKPRLVAASERSNLFTGFAGAEIKKMNGGPKDDRAEDKLSYAATNLVKPNLQSRSRQQSEPPMNRNMFPPTPPPETDKRNSGGQEGTMTRAQSVRGGGPKPQPLNLGRAAFDQSSRQQDVPRRIGTQRSASERPPPTRQESTRMRDRPRRRGSDEDIDEYAEDVYDLYQSRSSRGPYTRSRQGKSTRPMYIDEEEEDDYEVSDLDDFEMVSRSKSRHQRSPIPTRSGTTRRAPPVERDFGQKIRVKVHASDTRYVFIEQGKTMREFVQQIRDKFGIRSSFKVEIKDDGDMITMADQDDLDMAVQTARSEARKENAEVAKMEVWIKEV
ncbi:NADPH oxidase-like protein regulator NoxR [Sporormia fimetaria CBS 119925]|uniref:NADPH oxidase-like protein regulator NoxR n=1 Tax=Sporormia fimetaria CBS 119925 TaxID=1340428 RepID=A0A6A6VBR4_9PLEO|nr:NADPH oxidase-like protein regulator NoxR [Sporormia fimetaria CBS 119925]